MYLFFQPLTINALGPAANMANVSGAVASSLERPDRGPPAVSINSLVSHFLIACSSYVYLGCNLIGCASRVLWTVADWLMLNHG